MELLEFDEHRTNVVTERGPISYVEVGQGARVALFVHGVGTASYLWRNVIELLGPRHRCIALDLPLHGHTPARPEQPFTLSALARVVVDLCDALDLPPSIWSATTPVVRSPRPWRRPTQSGCAA